MTDTTARTGPGKSTSPPNRGPGTMKQSRFVRLMLAGFLGVLAFGMFNMVRAASETDAQSGSEQQRGYGRCSSCNCRHYEGSGNTCRNCGHNYWRHY